MIGLKQKILAASSSEEVQKLLSEGKTYEFASVKTRNSWKNAAARVQRGEKYVATKAEKKPVSNKRKKR